MSLHSAPKQKGFQTQRNQMRTFAVDKLKKTAVDRYGSVVDMFHAVRSQILFLDNDCMKL